jgi:Peptidase family C25
VKRTIICLILLSSIIIAQEGARYLIICADELENSIQPLAQWKHKKGVMTKVYTRNDLEPNYSWDQDGIKNFIRDAYNSMTPRPEYILLVGSAELLPAYGPYGDYDGPYADVEGDYREELSIGRFPAGNAAECDVMVAKTINYEKNPPNGDWFIKGTTIVREDDPQTPDPYYQTDASYIRDLWSNVAQYSVTQALIGDIWGAWAMTMLLMLLGLSMMDGLLWYFVVRP